MTSDSKATAGQSRHNPQHAAMTMTPKRHSAAGPTTNLTIDSLGDQPFQKSAPPFLALAKKDTQPTPSSSSQLNLFVYETDSDHKALAKASPCNRLPSEIHPSLRLDKTAQNFPNVNLHTVGKGSEFKGFGSKWAHLIDSLQNAEINDSDIVVVADNRDSLINIHKESPNTAPFAAFNEYVSKVCDENHGAIMLSAEQGCCVSALTHNEPGDYFFADGSRNQRTCDTGQQSCDWRYATEITQGDQRDSTIDFRAYTRPWGVFQQFIATQRQSKMHTDAGSQKAVSDSVFLNMGLLTGRKKDVIAFIKALNLEHYEDDQAVATDFFYRFPDKIVLDYEGAVLGSWGSESACPLSHMDLLAQQLVHRQTQQKPLFSHYPGFTTKPEHTNCFYRDAENLGYDLTIVRTVLRSYSPIVTI